MDLFVVPRSQTPVTLLVPPLKHLEAMAAGIPVLASDLPPLRETADDSGCVHLAPADDVTAWADAITGELASVDALRARGAAGRKWVREERTWSRNAQAYQVTYSKARTAPTGPVAP